MLNSNLVRAVQNRISASTPTRRFNDVPTWDYNTLEDDVERELECIRKAGIQRVVVVDLTKSEFGLPVVRVIVPGLEPNVAPGYLPGRRARAVLAVKQ